ncbi:DUF1003 domain-containing protein [soil metagenome]
MEKLEEILLGREEVKPEQLIKKLHSVEATIAQKITNFSGSMQFAYLHALWFIFWILANHGVFSPLIPIFDPFPYGLLTMVVSLEAIFLSTFILVAQNRQALVDTYRELEDDKEQAEEEKDQEELEQDVEGLGKEVKELGDEVDDIQNDLDNIIKGIGQIQQRLNDEKSKVGTKPTGNK